MASDCPPGNWQARVCALELAWSEINASLGHPPLSATQGPAFSFDPVAQVLVVPEPGSPEPSDTVRVYNDLERLNATPASMSQVLIQTLDTANGMNSIWVPSSLGTGAWTMIKGSMGGQNSNTVNITGGSISGISPPIPINSGGTGAASAAGARVNLDLPTLTPVSNVLDWAQTDNYGQGINVNTVWTFANLHNGRRLVLSVQDLGLHTHTFPADVAWPDDTQPLPTVSGTTHNYFFDRIGGIVFGRGYMDYVPPV